MIKVYLRNQNYRKETIIDENTTLRAALEAAGMGDSRGLITLSGDQITYEDLDKTFADFNVGDSVTLAITAKMDNAAAIILAGDVAVIKSAFSYDEIELLSKYSPKSLTLYEEEDGHKVEVFKVGVGATGKVSPFGISFAKNEDARANVTVTLPAEDRDEYVFDKLGPAVVKLGKLEEGFEAAIAEVAETKNTIETMITRI